MSAGSKLAIVAGAGDLPVRLAAQCAATGRPYFVARIAGMADPALDAHPGATFGLGEMGARFKALKDGGCDAVTFAGLVRRPDFKTLRLDARATLMLPKVLAAARRGDDALMRAILEEFEREGFTVVGPETVLGDLLAPKGVLGAIAPDDAARADVVKAAAIAGALGAWDVGQGAVVCDGFALALEAAEGTDAMLARVASLPEAVRGRADARRGVLVKRAKPVQDRRIDLPTIGLSTLEGAAAAGLCGIAIEAGGALIVDCDAVIARANALGLFVMGFDPADT
ncbi:MAG: UDP-2,3-diacylglucosamine diphosphatase LpxI [Hyphomonadaceae bacterium]|nr:UDP-2,3-diacylglucosamine diphosphatase LpxI [Hyphomonadaceae bacterium]